ncbi:prephenate dehydrogenase [Turicibacter sanguinis]|nr:prephenate dehydrogenase [Turicibacter sanguinis]
MADNKKYYYLKLKDNFFESEELVILQSMPDGYIYSDILMKLYLKSLKSEGRLMFKEHIPYNPTMLATVVRHPVALVEKALTLFKDLGLVDVLDNGAIFMLDIQNFIGKGSSEADRVKQYRERIKNEKKLLHCTNDVQTYENRTPEKEKEIEIEKDIELETEKKNSVAQSTTVSQNEQLIDEIIRYLNLKTNKNFRATTKAYRKEIMGRLNDKKANYQPEHFKYVIDVKCVEWLGTDMEKHLNPTTLFRAGNFDKYLNQPMPQQNKKTLRNLVSAGQIDLSDVL